MRAPLVVLSLALAGCASSLPPATRHVATRPPAEDASAPSKRPVPPGHLRREDVIAVLSDGPPSFLRKVDVDAVRDRGGRFYGWRIVAWKDDALGGGDVKPGDVVRNVNGKPIEDPFQFFDVFQSLAFAPELRVTIERDGAPTEVRYPIDDDPNAPTVPRPELGKDASPKAVDASQKAKGASGG